MAGLPPGVISAEALTIDRETAMNDAAQGLSDQLQQGSFASGVDDIAKHVYLSHIMG